MGIFTLVIASVIHITVILLDIAMALCLVRVLSYHFNWGFLNTFNQVGKPVIDQVTYYGREGIHRITGRDICDRRALAAGMLTLLAVRWIIVLFFNAVFV